MNRYPTMGGRRTKPPETEAERKARIKHIGEQIEEAFPTLMSQGEPPKGRKAMLGETRNPLPQKDYTHKQHPDCDDEENDPEIDGR